MKISLSDITDEGLILKFDEPIESNQFKLLSPVNALLRINRADTEILARGTITLLSELQCSRCVKTFSKDLVIPVNAVYHPIEEFMDEANHEIREDELDMDFYKGDELDIDELIKEQIILNMPLQPLCSDECKGICPGCGADLNIDKCRCEHRQTDSRLEILKTLLHNGKE